MKKLVRTMATSGLVLACAALFGTTNVHAQNEANTLTNKEKADGWELLFDGQTMNGWRDYNGTKLTGAWEAKDDCIQYKDDDSGKANSYITTDKQYENFILQWDWKMTKGGNSGLIYHVVERPQFNAPYLTGPEYQMIDEVNFPGKLEEWQRTACDYAMHLTNQAKMNLKPVGEWNTSKLVFNNGHVEHWLNGKKVVQFQAWTNDWFQKKEAGKWKDVSEYGMAKKGHFCFQVEGHPAAFKNIKIKELPHKAGKKVNLFNGKDLNNWVKYGTELWYVQDGLLVCESGPNKQYGYLGTRDYYDNFDLTVEFKQVADGNSGVFIRSIVDKNAKVEGWQVEVAPKGNDTGGIYESYGRGWLEQIPDEKENILQQGEWNKMRILLKGNNIQTWLNGQPMVNLTDDKIGAGQGRIALQIHAGGGIKVLWRNLKLKTL